MTRLALICVIFAAVLLSGALLISSSPGSCFLA